MAATSWPLVPSADAAPPRNAPPASASAPESSNEALYRELAARGQQRLLSRAFEVGRVPVAARGSYQAVPALRELTSPTQPLTASRRRELVDTVTRGADAIVAGSSDPKVLMEYATALIREGVQPEVNTLEYWGYSKPVQDRLRPIVQTVVQFLDKAASEAQAQRAKIEQKLNNGATPAEVEQWTSADTLFNTAAYTRHMVDYNLALAQPRDTAAGKEARTKIADEASTFLEQYDNEESGIQAAVQSRMAKLAMTKGDYPHAKTLFGGIVGGKPKPAPTAVEQYEARYFTLLCDLEEQDATAVRKGLADLVQWQQANLPADKTVQDGVSAAAQMMRYRLALLEKRTAASGQARDTADAEALKILVNLYEARPDLRGIINDQLVEQVSATADVKQLDPLLLNALVQKGVQERNAEKADASVLNKGIEAAREVLSRAGGQISPRMRDNATLAIPAILEKLGEREPLQRVAAANAYLDYVQKHKDNVADKATVDSALQQAGYLLLTMLQDAALKTDADVSAAYDRFLPIAVGAPFNRIEFAYDLARRLQARQESAEAIKYFRMLPATDRRRVTARFFEMEAMTDLLYSKAESGQPKLQGPERVKLLDDVLKLIDEIRRDASATLAGAADERDKANARLRLAGATLTAAELVAFNKPANWPAQVQNALGNFESATQGLANAEGLRSRALQLQVVAYMESKQFDKATASLVQLLEKTGGAKGADFVRGLILQLQSEYEAAEDANDTARMRSLADNIGNLSRFLVQWAAGNANADIRKFAYRYKVFAADAQRRAAALDATAASRQQRLQAALKTFEDLKSPQNVELYRQSQPDIAGDAAQPDPNVAYGEALTYFDLGNWQQANNMLRQLKANGKLGTPMNRVVDEKTAEIKYADNTQYWEGTYKLLKSAQEWAKADPSNADAQKELEASRLRLKQEYVRNVKGVGGASWKREFNELRKSLTPDFDPQVLSTTAPS